MVCIGVTFPNELLGLFSIGACIIIMGVWGAYHTMTF